MLSRTAALTLALLLFSGGAALGGRTHTASPEAVPVSGIEEAQEPWLLKAVQGEVCILHAGACGHTGISLSLLPEADRLLLQQGICAQSREELAALLEDLAS